MTDVVLLTGDLLGGQVVEIQVMGKIWQLMRGGRGCCVRVEGGETEINVEVQKICKVLLGHGGHRLEVVRLLPF